MRGWWRIVIYFVLVLVAGCAANNAGRPGVSNADPTFTYVRGDHVILLAKNSITLDGKKFVLTDCSSQKSYCYKNDQIGFYFKALKYCSKDYGFGNLYAFEDKSFRIFTLTPHVIEINYSYKNKDKFLYSYSYWRGLVGIIFNEFRDFPIPDPKNIPKYYDFGKILKYQYRIKGKQGPFVCHNKSN